MKRSILTIKQYDYSSVAEFEKHKKEMKSKGYFLLDENYMGGMFKAQEVVNGDKWVFTACYMKDTM